jgi:hypothetical protein
MRPHRFAPNGMPKMTEPWTSVPERFQAVALAQADRPAVVQSGGWDERFETARGAVAELLAAK